MFRTFAVIAMLGLGKIRAADDASYADLFALSETLAQAGQYERAYSVALQALSVAGPRESAANRALILNQIGLLSSLSGRLAEAEQPYTQALAQIENDIAQRPLLMVILHNLGSLYMEHEAKYAKAERTMRRALAVGSDLYGAESPQAGALLSNLGTTLLLQRRDLEAEETLRKALVILKHGPAPYQTNLASVLLNLGALTARGAEPARALPLLVRSVEVYTAQLGPTHPELLKPLVSLGRLYLVLKRWDLAEQALKQAAAIADRPASSPTMLQEVLTSYAIALRRNHQKEESRRVSQRVQQLRAGQPNRRETMTVHVSDLVESPSRIKLK